MEFRTLNTFIKAANLQSFSKAAQELGYSQAAVTIQIKQLEQELGVHLFDRIGKQTVLTHQGTVFYAHATAILREISRARAAVSNDCDLNGCLTLGTIESIGAVLLPPLIEELHRLYPNVKVRITLDSPEMLLNLMDKNAIDLVYLLDQKIYGNKWVKVLEEPENIVFISSPKHPLCALPSLTLAEAAAHPFLLTEKDASYRFILDQYFASQGQKIEPFVEIGNTEFIIRLLKNNAGLSFLPEFAVKQEVDAGLLNILPVRDFSLRIWRQIFYHKDKWVTGEMDAFIRLALNNEKKQRD